MFEHVTFKIIATSLGAQWVIITDIQLAPWKNYLYFKCTIFKDILLTQNFHISRYLLSSEIYPQANAMFRTLLSLMTSQHWKKKKKKPRKVNISLVNGLVPLGIKPSPKPMLTNIYDSIWCHQASMSYNIVLHKALNITVHYHFFRATNPTWFCGSWTSCPRWNAKEIKSLDKYSWEQLNFSTGICIGRDQVKKQTNTHRTIVIVQREYAGFQR